ncbi:phosphatidylethanolamine-binding protein homolog F40A3.3-like [Cotesia typhae]|uniref:phosphatidylethanolamine-binding protein homolog F40A3.3-like n=1 Tax=Cotesia typhae TaxID=2053667 RepID=UPI003D6944F5
MKILSILIGVFAIVTADGYYSYIEYGVIPYVLDSLPDALLQLEYGDKFVNPGDILIPTEAKDPPEIYYPFEDGEYYCFVLTGPDAPGDSYETMPEFWHGAIVNIPGDRISDGETLMVYMTPSPPDDNIYHMFTWFTSNLVSWILRKSRGYPRMKPREDPASL